MHSEQDWVCKLNRSGCMAFAVVVLVRNTAFIARYKAVPYSTLLLLLQSRLSGFGWVVGGWGGVGGCGKSGAGALD